MAEASCPGTDAPAGAKLTVDRRHWQAHSITAPSTGWTSHALTRAKAEPAYGAFQLLWIGFIAIPLVMGMDKFFNVLTNWEGYLAPWIANLSPLTAQGTMMAIGVVEVIAAISMALRQRYAAYVVALALLARAYTRPGLRKGGMN